MPTKPQKRTTKKPAKKRALPVRASKSITSNGRRYWTDDERYSVLAAVDANGGDVAKTARETGVPDSTIRCWRLGHRCPEALQLRDEKKGNLANACEELAWLFASEIPRKVDKAPLNHLTAGLGIMVEKTRLLRGEPTTYGRTDNTNRTVSVNLERLPPDERANFLRLLAMVTNTDAGTGGGSEQPSGAPEQVDARYKAAAVLG